jgi:hypothetical protein
MEFWQSLFILAHGLISLYVYIKGLRKIQDKKNIYGLTRNLFFLGVFVWGDVFVLGPFWIGTALLSLYLNNWYFYLFIISLFWLVRSLGETIYWLHEQFAGKNKNPPHTLNFHKIFEGEAIWFIYQLTWQCVLVFSIVLSIYFARLWLLSI